MDREVEAFVRFCRSERRLADLTCRAYERDVRACLTYLRDRGVTSWSEVRPPALRDFLADEALRRPAASSQARTVAALKGFFRFCVGVRSSVAAWAPQPRLLSGVGQSVDPRREGT